MKRFRETLRRGRGLFSQTAWLNSNRASSMAASHRPPVHFNAREIISSHNQPSANFRVTAARGDAGATCRPALPRRSLFGLFARHRWGGGRVCVGGGGCDGDVRRGCDRCTDGFLNIYYRDLVFNLYNLGKRGAQLTRESSVNGHNNTHTHKKRAPPRGHRPQPHSQWQWQWQSRTQAKN